MNHSQFAIRPIHWACVLLFLLTGSLTAETSVSPQDLKQSCGGFVQNFYDWYVPKALKETGEPASNIAIRHKSSAFSPELLRALKEDSQAQAMVSGEIVGMDFDPFLSGQDPCERYVVGNITLRKDSYLVEVYGVCSGKKHGSPDVVPEVMFKDGRWLFVNFHYAIEKRSDDVNLLGVLKRLREDRQKLPK